MCFIKKGVPIRLFVNFDLSITLSPASELRPLVISSNNAHRTHVRTLLVFISIEKTMAQKYFYKSAHALRHVYRYKQSLCLSSLQSRFVFSLASQSDLQRPVLHYSPPPIQAWVTSFQSGEKIGIIDLNNFVFGTRPRVDILHRVVIWQRAKIRAGTAKVKNRSEVRGGGRKPRQQKGSGRARQGSIRAPHFVGGGVVHGPRGNASYDYTLPKKVRKLGLRSALSVKYAQGDLKIVDALTLESHKTRDLLPILECHGLSSALLVDGGDVDVNVCLATQNLPKVDVLPSRGLNVYSILLRDSLILSVGALRMLEDRLSMDLDCTHQKQLDDVTCMT